MPFRVRITVVTLVALVVAVVVLPLVWPIAPLADTTSAQNVAGPGARFVEAPGIALHVTTFGRPGRQDEVGDAVPWVFLGLHGFGASSSSFAALASALADAGPFVAYDRPGFGATERPTPPFTFDPYDPDAEVGQALAVLDATGASRAVLVAHSSGAALAVRLAAAAPERVIGAILVGPNDGRPGGSGAPAWLLATPHAHRVGPALMRQLGGEPGVGLLTAAYADPAKVRPEVLASFEAARRVDDWDVGLWQVVTSSRPLPPGAWGVLDGDRVVVVAGSDDAIVPVRTSEALALDDLGAAFVEIEGCGHAAHEECPNAVADVAEGALRTWGLRPPSIP